MSTSRQHSRDDDRVLIMMRHATADFGWGVEDHERSLSPQGHREAPLAGRWLVHNGFVPEMMLCSSALRTRQTCTWVSSELGDLAPTASLSGRLYEASERDLLAEINAVPEAVRAVMLICHQPAVQNLVMRLASADSDMGAVMELSAGYPPAGVAVLRTSSPWAALDGADARLVNFMVPGDDSL